VKVQSEINRDVEKISLTNFDILAAFIATSKGREL